MIDLTENTVAVWFMSVHDDCDYMAHLGPKDGRLVLTYRFRYYEGDQSKQFEDSEDRKNWYRLTMGKLDRDAALARMRQVLRAMQLRAVEQYPAMDHALFEVINEGDFDGFVREFMQQPWTRAKWKGVKGVGPVEIREQ